MTQRRDFIARATSGAAMLTGGFAAPAVLACGVAARHVGGSPTKQAFDAMLGQTLRLDPSGKTAQDRTYRADFSLLV